MNIYIYIYGWAICLVDITLNEPVPQNFLGECTPSRGAAPQKASAAPQTASAAPPKS